MSDPHTQNEIIQQLETISAGITNSVQHMSVTQFTTGTDHSWSAENYLKHLLLSIKPLAKAIHFPTEQLQKMFGLSERASRTYAEVVSAYKKRLDEGIRAEDFTPVTPTVYRFPDGVSDHHAYLLQSWQDANIKLINRIVSIREDELDSLQMPHPAIGTITLREILFFTIYHNNLHWRDIQHAGGL